MNGTCALHQRPAEQTCARCGLFVCDWCLKLAPSWGPGLCAQCQRVAPPRFTRLVPMARGAMVGVLLVGWVGLSQLSTLVEPSRAPERRLGSAIVVVLCVGVIVGIVRLHRRHGGSAPPRREKSPASRE